MRRAPKHLMMAEMNLFLYWERLTYTRNASSEYANETKDNRHFSSFPMTRVNVDRLVDALVYASTCSRDVSARVQDKGRSGKAKKLNRARACR